MKKSYLFYALLSIKKDRRRYAAMEAIKLGHGGINYIAELLGCCRDTISKAIKELKELPIDCRYDPRIRQLGGGRKPYHQTIDGIDEAFLDVVITSLVSQRTRVCCGRISVMMKLPKDFLTNMELG